MGSLTSTSRSSEQTEVALFWALNTALAWDRIAVQLSVARGLSLTENARLFEVLNVSMVDAIIACWDSKYRYLSWRPVTAIRAAAAPGDPDSNWQPLLDSLTGTPAHPEYPSAHSSFSGAAAFVLADFFGENTAFSATSEILPGTTRSYTSFSEERSPGNRRCAESSAAFTSEAVAPAGIQHGSSSRGLRVETRAAGARRRSKRSVGSEASLTLGKSAAIRALIATET